MYSVILIARLLLPSDYGIIAMLTIFMAVAQTFIDSGFSTALVRKLDRTQTDFSTVFYFNIVVSVIAYIGLWIASPFISDFYNIPLLKNVTKVIGLNLIIPSLSGIHNAKLTIAIDFKSRAKISVFTTILTGAIGLGMAFNGYGVWALVFQAVFSNILGTILLWYFVRWMPSWEFSWKSFRELFSFGSLGVYSRALGLAEYLSSNITSVLQSVTFPVLSTIQNEEERLAMFT